MGGQKNEKREQRRDLCLKNLRPSGESLDEGAAPLLGEQGRVVRGGVVGEPGPLDEGEDDGVLLPNQRVPHPSQRQILWRWRLLLLVHLAATEEGEQRVKKTGRRGGGGARKKCRLLRESGETWWRRWSVPWKPLARAVGVGVAFLEAKARDAAIAGSKHSILLFCDLRAGPAGGVLSIASRVYGDRLGRG